MTCALAAAVVATAIVAGPQCPRADRGVPLDVMAALTGSTPTAPRADPAFEAAIRAIRAAPARNRRSR